MYMVSYDIADEKRLHKTARVLEDYGGRMQKSVFYCDMSSAVLKKMVARLREIVDDKEDSVMIQPLCFSCAQKVDFIGREHKKQITEFSEKFKIL